MFNIFIAETILKQVIETEGKKPEGLNDIHLLLSHLRALRKMKNSTNGLICSIKNAIYAKSKNINITVR